MKVRTDFVTNSSSTSYVVEFQLKSESGATATYEINTWDSGGYYDDGSSSYEPLFKWGWPIAALDLNYPVFPHYDSLEKLVSALLESIEVTPYPEGVILDKMGFFIVGEPTRYASRKELEDFIRRNAGTVTGFWDADFVILCGDDKERFCERWPWGHSYFEMDEAEQEELDEAVETIEEKIQRSIDAMENHDSISYGPIPWALYTGSREPDYGEARDGWKGWTLDNLQRCRLPLPVLSEEEFAFFDPNGPAGHGALSAMPGAVEAFVKKCDDVGITMDILRIVGGKILVTPFGDSVWESDDFYYQWGVNAQTDEVLSTGKVVTRYAGSLDGRGDIWDVDTSWMDTQWWPFTGESNSVPYESVTAGAIDRRAVRRLDLSSLDTSQTTNMEGMFRDFENLRRLDLSALDTSHVTNMKSMFFGCKNLLSLNLSGLNTSQVTDMSVMFGHCERLTALDVSSLDTSKVTAMISMFFHCEDVEALDLTGFDTSHVTSMSGMFYECDRLRSLDLSSWDTSQVKDMSFMFFRCWSIRELDFSRWDTSRVVDMTDMFACCMDLERWAVPESWPLGLDGAIPEPTAENDRWWSERDGRWMAVDEIRARGPMADTFTSTH